MTPSYEPKHMPRLFDYKGDLSKRWYIEYYLWDTDTQAFVKRRYWGMNKYTTAKDRRQVSRQKLEEIRKVLEDGYAAGKKALEPEQRFNLKSFTLKEAIIYFLNYKNAITSGNEQHQFVETYHTGKARISQNMFASYCTLKNLLFRWLQDTDREKLLLVSFNLTVSQKFFTYLKEDQHVGPKTYNNYKGYLSSVINYYINHEELPLVNPLLKIESLTVESSDMHMPFTNEQLQLIEERIKEKQDPQLALFIKFLYYLFIRPGIELRFLQVKDIKPKTILVRSSKAKNNKGEHIVIPAALEALIQEYKLRSYPADYYVFTQNKTPGPQPAGVNYFYKRHRKLLDELNLVDEQYTLYGYKHTGAINLYEATKDLLIVQRHCRHSSSSQTDEYLRKYGVIIDTRVVNMPLFGAAQKAVSSSAG